LLAFKSCKHCGAGFSKEVCSLETYLAVLKTGRRKEGKEGKRRDSPDRFSKALGAASRKLLPNRSEDLNSPFLKSFLQIKKL
jgi:hypothetical protein